MKNFLSILLILLFSVSLFAQGDGIKFSHESWEDLLAKAKTENKLIFVDAYTTWCGPCKQMAKNVFPMKEVGEVYNLSFVNVKIDMERGEGISIRKKYGVNAFPTYLFIDGDGQLIHKGIGSQPADQFIELAKAALNPATQLITLENSYKRGDRDPQFLKNYANALQQTGGKKYGEIVNEYLKTQKNWLTPKNVKFIFQATDNVKSPNYDFIIKNKTVFRNQIGAEKFDKHIGQVILHSSMRQKKVDLEEVAKLYEAALPEKAGQLTSVFKLQYYMYSRAANAKDKFIECAVKHSKRYKFNDANLLNSCAWRFYELTDDEKLLKKAVKWGKKSVKLESQYTNNDTVAALYYKLGKKKAAIKYANKAIEEAKISQQDYKSTEDLLKKIEIM